MSSTSEPPILATQVGILEHVDEHTETIQPHKPKSQEALVKRVPGNILSTSTISETSDHSSSLLWTPAQPLTKPHTKPPKQPTTPRSHRKSHKSKRRLYKDEKTTESGETSAFLSKHEQEKQHQQPEMMCSFERDHQHNRRKSRNSSGRNSSRRSNKKHQELYNDYTRYQYHRRSHRDKHRKHKSRSSQKVEPEASMTTGLPKIIKRIKDFFFGKKTEEDEEHSHGTKSPKEHRKHSEEHSISKKHKREISGKLFRSASDSDLEAVKHHHRRALHKNNEGAQDDLLKTNKHWKSRRHQSKLQSIGESSDRSGKLGSGSDAGKLVLSRSGRTTYNDFAGHGHKNGDVRRPNGHCKKDEKDTSEGSHSMESSHSKRRYRRRSKEYQSLKKKWAKQHQSFENDLEKLEKLVELIGMKNTKDWLEQKSSENTSLLERLEATQEKCVAEVDFTRHVLICKLQRLENKLEESLSTIDYNNNNTLTDDKGRSIEEIREEMSKECRDLRKLLQETSNQLKQVLDEKPVLETTDELENDGSQNPEGAPSPLLKRLSRHSQATNEDLNTTTDIPFPELSHHPLNTRRSRKCETEPSKQEHTEKPQRTRVTTYV